MIQKWIHSAENNLASAEHLAQTMDRNSFRMIWRHCHQAAEKYLKALIISKHRNPPNMKNLLKPLEICEEYAKIELTEIYRECERLTDYDVGEHEYDSDDMKDNVTGQALKDIEKIRYFVTSYLEESLK